MPEHREKSAQASANQSISYEGSYREACFVAAINTYEKRASEHDTAINQWMLGRMAFHISPPLSAGWFTSILAVYAADDMRRKSYFGSELAALQKHRLNCD